MQRLQSDKKDAQQKHVVIAAPPPEQPPIETETKRSPLLGELVKEQEEARKLPEINESISELLSKFLKLRCFHHSVRDYDHICINNSCKYKDVLLCSKCLLQDERHVSDCKNNINSLEEYVPKKVEELAGKRQKDKLYQLREQVNGFQKETQSKICIIKQQIEEDIKEIIGSVSSMCDELRKLLMKQVDLYEKTQKSQLNQFSFEIDKSIECIQKEEKRVEEEIKLALITNFNFENKTQVTEFMKNVREKANQFAVDSFVKHEADKLEEYSFDLKNNQNYKRSIVNQAQKDIYSVIQIPLQEAKKSLENQLTLSYAHLKVAQIVSNKETRTNLDELRLAQSQLLGEGLKSHKLNNLNQPNEQKSFLDFSQLKIQEKNKETQFNQVVQESISDLIQCSDKKQIVAELTEDEKKNSKISSQMTSLQQKVILQTDHKLPINSLAIINTRTFATIGNDSKLKVWGFTHNYVIHLKVAVLLNELGLQVLYNKETNKIFVATSKGSVQTFNYDELNNTLTQDNNLIKHDKTVRNICFLPKMLITLSYDKTIKVWDIFNASTSPLLLSVDIPADEDCKFIEVNQKYALVGTLSGNVLIYFHNLTNSSQNAESYVQENNQYSFELVNKLKCSKEKITSIVLGTLNSNQAFVGSGNGTISFLDLSKQNPEEIIIHKIRHTHKQRIGSLNLFENGFLLASSWEGIINLYDINSKQVISSTKYLLQNDEKKHSDGQGAKVAVILPNEFYILALGNNDKQVQIFCLQLSEIQRK